MDKIELGRKLRDLRDSGFFFKVDMTEYQIRSIELGRSSYSVYNLIKYVAGCEHYLIFTDTTLGEKYKAENLEDVHNIIALLLKNWNVELPSLYGKIGVHYTPPKSGNNRNPLSIDTLLRICNYFHCDISFGK